LSIALTFSELLLDMLVNHELKLTCGSSQTYLECISYHVKYVLIEGKIVAKYIYELALLDK